MQIKEITQRNDITSSFQILKQIYNNISEENYVEEILNMMQRGYKMAGVFDKNSEDKCIGVVGIRVIRKLQFGRSIEIEDFMIDRAKRGIGVGKMLIKWVEWQAANFGCLNIIGFLGNQRAESQKIYSRERFDIEGLFFQKTLS
jgi:GNAT superfamily N-acetyltransferase